MSYKNFKIANGVDGIFIENTRFNTTVISLNFYLPLSFDSITPNALLPYLLTSCSDEYRDYSELNLKLSMLYGADIAVSVDKMRDVQHVKIAISVINDEFAFEKDESIVSKGLELLLSLIFEPIIENDQLSVSDTEREKRKLIEHIAGEINDKRTFAKNRLMSIMFEGSPYGVSKYGSMEMAKEVTPADLYKAWQSMLNDAYIRVQVIGKSLPEGVFEGVAERLSKYNRDNIVDYTACVPTQKAETVKEVTEFYDVAQGKLVMGFSSEVCGENAFSFSVMADIFGGGPYSRLFENVREKMSLCYYCSASALRSKGLMLVQSGVEAENAEKAEKEILNQLELVRKGKFSDFAFEASKKAIIGSLKAYNDSVSALDRWYSSAIMRETLLTPEKAIDKISEITRQDIIDAAKGISLNTVYKLMPKEESK